MRNHFIQTKPSPGGSPAPRDKCGALGGETRLVVLLALMAMLQAGLFIWDLIF